MRHCSCGVDISERHLNAKLCIACFNRNKKQWHKEHAELQNEKRNKRRAENLAKYKEAEDRRSVARVARYHTDPEFNAHVKARVRMRRTGCSQEQFAELLRGQQGKCAICSVVMQETSRGPCVDHCHTTGVVRGLLCSKCNAGIGQLQDSYEIVQAAANYLAQYNSRGNT